MYNLNKMSLGSFDVKHFS